MDTATISHADLLLESHFRCQRGEGSDFVHVSELDAFLRGLLFTDGTVTRALEVHMLDQVTVEVLDQTRDTLPARAAAHLEATPGAECLRRRVTMTASAAPLGVWAESFILPDRLPPGFLAVLGGAPQGIGESIQGVRLESARDLLSFRLDHPPGWAVGCAPATTVLTRLYRVITSGTPALLIAEMFAVEHRDGQWHMLGCEDGSAASGAAYRKRVGAV